MLTFCSGNRCCCASAASMRLPARATIMGLLLLKVSHGTATESVTRKKDGTMLIHPERWQNLRSRYEEDRPHRMLALDGGGIRGLLTLGILEKIEALVKERTGAKSLCDYFD